MHKFQPGPNRVKETKNLSQYLKFLNLIRYFVPKFLASSITVLIFTTNAIDVELRSRPNQRLIQVSYKRKRVGKIG